MIGRNRGLSTVVAFALSMLIVSGCDNGLTEINKNPNAPEDVPLNNVLLQGIWDLSNNSAERGYFGQWVVLYHGDNWAQHLAQPVYNNEDVYIERPGIPENVWDEMYSALTDLQDVKRLAVEAGDDNAWAIAEVMTVFGFAFISDYFGDIPYSEALKLADPDNPIQAPHYDAQADVYADLISRLDSVASVFDPGAIIQFGDFDPVYQGDVAGWAKFANSLRLRLAMRMANAAPGMAQAAFEDAWASDIYTSVDDQAAVHWEGEYPSANPTYRGVVYSGRTGDFRLSESLVDRLIAFNDPRLDIYADSAGNGGQVGLRNGLIPSDYTPALGAADFSTIGSYFLDPATPSVLMSYSEMLFLGAEAAELGWNVGGATAEDLYNEAITASMESLGVDGADISAYLAQADVGYTTGTYQGIDAIHVQKWIALYQAGPEAFNDLRRYGWDWTTDTGTSGTDLVPAENSVLPAGVFPARFPSSENEELFNENAPEAKTITDKVWWAQ